MKKLVSFFTVFILIATTAFPNELWNKESIELFFYNKDKLIITNNGSSKVTLHSNKAETKSDKKSGKWHAEEAKLYINEYRNDSNSPNKKIYFTIDDINNNPSDYGYRVITEDGKSKLSSYVIWGVDIHLRNTFQSKYAVSIAFINVGHWYYFLYERVASKQIGIAYGNTDDIMISDYRDWPYSNSPEFLEIKLHGEDKCSINFGGYTLPTISNITGIDYIDFYVAYGAKIAVCDAQILTETLYSQVSDHISNGKHKQNKGEYLQAATEYSKAIDKGYRNYEIYKLRAEAYFANEFYNNAIEDCDSAIYYNPSEEIFLLRAKIKYCLSDPSYIDDLRKGGTEGVAIAKEITSQASGSINSNVVKKYTSTGSGLIITKNGILVTNHHVINKAKKIDILVNINGITKTYNAKVLLSDRANDLSLLKIDDPNFESFNTIPFSINSKLADVGTNIFTLGYPMSGILGEEIKLTDGLISSKTGYQGDITTYQISAPIQPGNSGGPLFNKKGELIGITNAGIPDAQNVGYAIKTSYLENLINVAPEPVKLPTTNLISNLPFTEKIKKLTPYVVLIKVY